MEVYGTFCSPPEKVEKLEDSAKMVKTNELSFLQMIQSWSDCVRGRLRYERVISPIAE